MQVFRVPKVCSAITIGGLNAENLSKLDKSEFILKIINKVKEQDGVEVHILLQHQITKEYIGMLIQR